MFDIWEIIMRRHHKMPPVPVTNLERVLVSAKLTWEPSKSRGVVSQRIKITKNDKVIIEKDLAKKSNTFSFASGKGLCIATISPFNGIEFGEAVEIQFEI